MTLFDKVTSYEKSQGDYLFYSYPNAQISVTSKVVWNVSRNFYFAFHYIVQLLSFRETKDMKISQILQKYFYKIANKLILRTF